MRHRRSAIAGIVVAAVVLVAVLVWQVSGSDTDSGRGSAGSGSSTPSASETTGGTDPPTPALPTPAPTTASQSAGPSTPVPTERPSQAPTSRPPVDLDDPSSFGDGVRASLVRVRRTTIEAQGPGEVSGPGVRVTVQIVNGRDRPLALGAVVVNATWGDDATPAVEVDSGTRSFTGSAKAGARARGVYAFSLPADGLSDLTVSVSHSALSPVVVFRGPVR